MENKIGAVQGILKGSSSILSFPLSLCIVMTLLCAGSACSSDSTSETAQSSEWENIGEMPPAAQAYGFPELAQGEGSTSTKPSPDNDAGDTSLGQSDATDAEVPDNPDVDVVSEESAPHTDVTDSAIGEEGAEVDTLVEDTEDQDELQLEDIPGDSEDEDDDPPEESEEEAGNVVEICDDELDNNDNSLVDCADPECADASVCQKQPEDCAEPGDEDKDGLINCEDPDCFNTIDCVEICADQADNDADGLTDCEDPDCLGSDSCPVETCLDFYDCLLEQGCNCEKGVDCPEDVSPEGDACQAACVEDDACFGGCFASLSPGVGENFQNFYACQAEHCSNIPAGSLTSCINTHCPIEYAQCFATGTLDCSYYAFECSAECSGPDCTDICLAQLSFPGLYEALQWNQCRATMCDKNGDGSIDSEECLYLSSMYVCSAQFPSCLPGNINQEGTECGQLLDCSGDCFITDAECNLACLETASLLALSQVSAVYDCVLDICTMDNLGTDCIQAAINGACLSVTQACQANP